MLISLVSRSSAPLRAPEAQAPGVTPSTALPLSKFSGTSAAFWMNLQLRWDLYHAQQREADQIETIRPRKLADAPGGASPTT